MRTIYEPKGKAKEYADLALNLYAGCTNGCLYCFVPLTLKMNRDKFQSSVQPRPGVLEATKERLAQGDIKGREIFMCFACDPFPNGVDATVTYEAIKLIKESGNHVALLTKGNIDTDRLFALLDENDRFGVTISCGEAMAAKYEPNAAKVSERLEYLRRAKEAGIKTFVSCEPVLEPKYIYFLITQMNSIIDEYRIGKLNYYSHTPPINWKTFGDLCEELCQRTGVKYLLKADLRAQMGGYMQIRGRKRVSNDILR